MHNIAIILSERGYTLKFCLLFIFLFPMLGYAQSVEFSKDSIPVVDGKVVFSVNFEHDLDKEEFMKRSIAYLNNKLDPYSGVFLFNSRDSTVCRITDYLEIDAKVAQLFAIYVTYSLRMTYEEGRCTMTIWDFTYMEKTYFETQEASERKLNMPEYSGEYMMIDKSYTRLMTKDPAGRITEATVNRINEIISNLELSFVRK
ncbi:hypothetical protein [uncultured Proteiniphilum sp.]|uniref:hypothetical protein n=1 Tax=uncultured Proteiniphilum sp. TaxID=497637 RepID=UPI0026257992|nr:hypothetical protein [uncultured Proteiniphilum sp.]